LAHYHIWRRLGS